MFKKTIKYEDFNGSPRAEDFYFNLRESELTKWLAGFNGGAENTLNRLIQERNLPAMLEQLESLINLSYGVKSDDGKYFRKSPEALEDFKSTNAYEVLYLELLSDPDKYLDFLKAIVPGKYAAAINDAGISKDIVDPDLMPGLIPGA